MAQNLSRFGGFKGIQVSKTGFFRTEKIDGRWWLVDPDGYVFISIGLNHISSDPLKHPDNLHLFQNKYKNDETWIKKGLKKDLHDWGFNTIGWTQEIALRYEPLDPLKSQDKVDARRNWGGKTALIHDRVWEHERYRWARIPYCHMLNFVNNAYWWDGYCWHSDYVPHYPDVFNSFFEDYCDWTARHFCTQMAEDPYLIGYFHSDVPDWAGEVHTNSWAKNLNLINKEDQGRLMAIAKRYYQVTHDAIHRYDQNHLILGDRFLGDRTIPQAVLQALIPTVDVLSIQYGGNFQEEKPKLDECYQITQKPVLMADAVMPPQYYPEPCQKNRSIAYRRYITESLNSHYVIGVHFCGAYIENDARCWGIKKRNDEPEEDLIQAFKQVHPLVYAIAGG